MTERLPLFPLNNVLYPGLVMPLNVFEERYRRLVADLVDGPEDRPRRFGVLAIKDGREVAPVRPDDGPAGPLDGLGTATGDPLEALHHIGCVADVTSVQPQPDGRYELLVTGTTRFRLRSVDVGGPYLVGEAEPIEERTGEGSRALAAEVERAFRTYQRRLAGAREASTVGRRAARRPAGAVLPGRGRRRAGGPAQAAAARQPGQRPAAAGRTRAAAPRERGARLAPLAARRQPDPPVLQPQLTRPRPAQPT